MIIKILKVLIPFVLLFAAAFGAWKLVETRPVVETAVPEKVIPAVRILRVEPQGRRLAIKSQGTVTARTVTEVIPEVAGKVTYVSPALAAGGFFAKGEVLLRIDPLDYELALTRARAEVAQAELRLEQERAEAAVAASEWEELGKGESASPLVLRKPQVAQAEAALQAAKAALEQARRDLERTEVRAPFDGRVRQENVDIGQFVSRGAPLAQIYSVDIAEVRLPIPSEDLAYVDLPMAYRTEQESESAGPEVRLKANWAGREHVWTGRIVRTEGEIDTNTRMVYAVAQVKDPYAPGKDPKRPPLAVGMFVEAEVLGHWIGDAVTLPRSVLHADDTVYVIGSDGLLQIRRVEVFRREKELVLIESGLREGEMVCLSPLDTVVDGMEVRVIAEENAL